MGNSVFYSRMIKGLWCLAEGAIYASFSRATHVIKTYPKDQIIAVHAEDEAAAQYYATRGQRRPPR